MMTIMYQNTAQVVCIIVQEPKPYILVNLVLSDKVLSLLILVAWGMDNQNQEGAQRYLLGNSRY